MRGQGAGTKIYGIEITWDNLPRGKFFQGNCYHYLFFVLSYLGEEGAVYIFEVTSTHDDVIDCHEFEMTPCPGQKVTKL